MLPHYLVKTTHLALLAGIVDHTHNTSTGSCQIHLLLGKLLKLRLAEHCK